MFYMFFYKITFRKIKQTKEKKDNKKSHKVTLTRMTKQKLLIFNTREKFHRNIQKRKFNKKCKNRTSK